MKEDPFMVLEFTWFRATGIINGSTDIMEGFFYRREHGNK